MVGLKDFDMPSCCNSCGHWSFNRDDEPLCDLTYEYIGQFDKRQEDCPLVETYTKADIVSMLEELKKEIIELPFPQREPEYMQGYSYCQTNVLDYVIQQKINSLKEKT